MRTIFTLNCVEKLNLRRSLSSVIWTSELSTTTQQKPDFPQIGARPERTGTLTGAAGWKAVGNRTFGFSPMVR
jgi:hypothetical protein